MKSRFAGNRRASQCALLLVVVLWGSLLQGGEEPCSVPGIAPEDLGPLLEAIRPQPGESPWRDIPWFTSIREARERAAAEGKPIVVFTAADGSPLART